MAEAGGRSRGRSRTEEDEPVKEAGAGAGAPEPAIRGRGGYRAAETLRTIPEAVPPEQHAPKNEGNLRLVTNYFRLKVSNTTVIYCYRVDFEPNVEALRVRRGLVFSLAELFNSAYLFDGGNEIKSLHKLAAESTHETTKRDGTKVMVSIRPTTRIGWGHPEMLRFYNTQMRRNLQHMGFTQIGRDYYDRAVRTRLDDHQIEVWPGISTAINEHDGGILMCTDLIHKVIRKETALDMLRKFLQQHKNNFQDVARAKMPGMVVMTAYNNKTYRIDDIVFDKNPESYTFERNGTTISLKDYYKEQYNHTCEDDRQPLLLVQPTDKMRRGGDDKEILLMPELCLMTGLTDMMRADFHFKKALGNVTRHPPESKAQALVAFMRRLKACEQVKTEMIRWKLGFEDDLIKILARSCTGEKIYTFQEPIPAGGTLYNQSSGNFEREIRQKKMFKAAQIVDWVLIAPRSIRAVVEEFMAAMKRVTTGLGVATGPPKIFPMDDDRNGTYNETIRGLPKATKLAIVVVPNQNSDRYSLVKNYFCCERPIPSQVITSKVIGNPRNLMSVTTKIVIQMATKLGAQPWALHIPPPGVMFIGYDTYHDSERKGWSVGGFVASMNDTATSWFSRTTYHQNRDELCANFANNFRSGLRNWRTIHGSWPNKIVIYRDGVSEGQIPHVYNVEMKDIKNVLTEKEGLDAVGFCFIIVTKRVAARFFLHDNGKLSNPPAGTVIDSTVTRAERYDFFLISQCVNQGTVNPVMYNIIADNTKWGARNHQALAYKMCHLYYNWAGTITVPAPCQYAHKLAYLTGTALHREHHQELNNNLFFL